MIRKTIAVAAALAATTAAPALAAGLDRSMQSVLPIFDEPGSVGFSLSYALPSITGRDINTGAQGRYDAGENFAQVSFSYTGGINERLTYAIIGDQPFGADVFYDDDPRSSNLGGTKADLSGDALTFLLRYEVTPRVSVFGGPRFQKSGGEVALSGLAYANALGARAAASGLAAAVATAAQTPGAPNQGAAQAILAALGEDAGRAFAGVASGNPQVADLSAQLTAAGFGTDVAVAQGTFGALAGPAGAIANTGGYNVDIDESWGTGLTLGAAYEIPDIALRLAVTYHSEIGHEGDSIERAAFFPDGVLETRTRFNTPQSVNVEFQTGVAEDTLLLAGLRWTDWDDFDVVPPALGSDLADIEDGWRWNLGVARRFTPAFVGLASLTYEPDTGKATKTPLGPSDGLIGINLGGRYELGALDIAGAVNYSFLGNAQPGVAGEPVALFEDNDAFGVGLRLTYEF